VINLKEYRVKPVVAKMGNAGLDYETGLTNDMNCLEN
jgi:hypothetical protein